MLKRYLRDVISAAVSVFAIASCFSAPMFASDQLSAASTRTETSDVPILYKVKVERGQFRTISGATRSYTLYIPETGATLPPPPYPMVVLVHGFLMSGHQHSGNAEYFAEHGIIALTPDMTKVLLGDDTRMGNVMDILDEIRWLTDRSNSPGDSFHGLLDVNRVGIAGNSAGGAVCLELLYEAQKAHVPIKATCSLDGVPWDRTLNRMAKLEPTNILSLRAEPGLCNYHARMLNYLALLKFPFDDVKINGAHHCDVENPSTFGCRCVCGSSNDKYRKIFSELTYLYFRDMLQAPKLDGPNKTFIKEVHSLQSDGKVAAELYQRRPNEIAHGGQQIE